MDQARAQLSTELSRLLAGSQLGWEERVQVAAAVFITEALYPFWQRGDAPLEAHESLRAREPDLAAAIESLAPLLLARMTAAEEARELVQLVETFLRTPAGS